MGLPVHEPTDKGPYRGTLGASIGFSKSYQGLLALLQLRAVHTGAPMLHSTLSS